MNKLTDTYTLANGVEIPCVGFGTWQTPDGEIAVNAVAEALGCGYRHVDTAYGYRNEASVTEGIRRAGLDRKDVFITSKIWNNMRGYDKALVAFDKSMARLGIDYLDLYLIHWPANELYNPDWTELNLGTWKALTKLYKDGRIRAIGVSNFKPHHLRPLMETEVPPMVNQIEYHPGCLNPAFTGFCRENGVLIEAYSPLGTGRILDDPTLKAVAAAHGKSVAQVCIRWCLQHDVLPLPKSVTPARIAENARVFDFALTEEEMARIDALPETGGAWDPDTADF